MQPKKRMSPKMSSWHNKLAMWRKNHRHVDGSLPSLKSAMKACKGRRVSTKRCRRRSSFRKHRKAPGQYSPKRASPKRKSPLRKAGVQMRAKLSAAVQKKQQKPAVFGQKAPANPMFVRGTAKKQQSPAAQKKQQKPATQKKQQMSFGQRAFGGPKKQSPAAQRKPQFGQKAQAKPAPAMRFA